MGRRKLTGKQEPEDSVALATEAEAEGAESAPSAPAPKRGRWARKEVLCVFRGESSKDTEFAEVDEHQVPLCPCCRACGDCASKLRPGVPLSKLCVDYVAGKKGADPSFQEDFDTAFPVYAGEQEGNFSPATSVAALTKYGMRVSQSFGLLSDVEYAAIFGGTVGDLLRYDKSKAPKSVQIPYQGPLSGSAGGNYWLIDLVGLPVDEILACRKAEIFYEVTSEMEEAILQTAQQIHQEQGHLCFQYLCTAQNNSRSKGLSTTSQRPKSVKELKEIHETAARVASAAMEAAAAPAPAEDANDDEAGEAAPPTRSTRPVGFGLPSSAISQAKAKPAAKKGQKGFGKGKTTSQPPPATTPSTSTPTPTPGTAAHGMQNNEVEVASGSQVGNKGGKQSEVYERLDAVMKRVADKHLQCSSAASIKSLEHLDPSKFLFSPSKLLSNSLNGAKKILETLQKAKQSVAGELLQNRIAVCEHANQLSISTTPTRAKFAMLKAHIGQTADLWRLYPWSLQVKLALRFASETLKTACDLFTGAQGSSGIAVKAEKGNDTDQVKLKSEPGASKTSTKPAKAAWAGQVNAFMAFFDFDVTALSAEAGNQVFEFLGTSPRFNDTLGIMKAKLAETKMDLEKELELDLEGGADPAQESVKVEAKEAAEEMATAIQEAMMCESLLEIFRKGSDSHEFTVFFAEAFVNLCNSKRALWEHLDGTPFAAVSRSIQEVNSFMGCLLFLFDHQVAGPDGSLTDAGSAVELLRFTEGKDSSSSEVYSTSMRSILLKNSWYAGQTSEVARTAATRKTLQPQLDRLRGHLADNSSAVPSTVPTSTLQELAALFEEVKSGIRAVELQAITDSMETLVRGAAIHLIDGDGGAQGMDAGRVAAIFKLVQSMTDVAGFPSLLQDFSTWCDKTSKARGVQELVKQMQACSRTQVNVDEIKKLLPGEDSKVGGTGARELFSAAAHCVVKTAELCVDKVLGPSDERLVNDIRKELLLILGVGKRIFGKSILGDLIQGYGQFLQAGASLTESYRFFEQKGRDVDARMGHAKSMEWLLALKNGRAKCSQCLENVKKIQAAVQGLDSLESIVGEAGDDESVVKMMDMFIQNPFAVEDTEEHIYADGVAWQCSQLQKDLDQAVKVAVESCRGLQAAGQRDWKAKLSASASLSEVLDASLAIDRSENPLNAKDLRANLEKCSEALKAAKHHIDTFDEPTLGSCAETMARFKQTTEELRAMVSPARVLLVEVFLIHQARKIQDLQKQPAKADDLKLVKDDTGKLITKFTVSFVEGVFSVDSSHVQKVLWAECEKYRV